MLEFHNVEVYGLEQAVSSCRYAMMTEMPDYSSDATKSELFRKGLERAKKLVAANNNTDGVHCHANFRTGISVHFDMKYSQYITKQLQRYHWLQYVSSSSMMHKITKMDFSKCCNKYVLDEVKYMMRNLVADYNEAPTYEKYMTIISNCPMGAELFVHVNTNYEQLHTMYCQRKHHKLQEDYKAFTDMVEALPYAKELIIGEEQ